MEEKLSMCSSYLQGVEEKLIELESSMDGDLEERAAKIGEALNFVRGAQKELSTAWANIDAFDVAPIDLVSQQR
jgi:hypothetical protein